MKYVIAIAAALLAFAPADANANYLRQSPHHTHRVANEQARPDPSSPYVVPHKGNNVYTAAGSNQQGISSVPQYSSSTGLPMAPVGNRAAAEPLAPQAGPMMGDSMMPETYRAPIAVPSQGVYSAPLTTTTGGVSEGWGYAN